MFSKIRTRLESEKGFTLIELLVVILIIGILAAIAIPSFLSQREKGQDTCAKTQARTAQTALETYYTDAGDYVNGLAAQAAADALAVIEPQVANTASKACDGATIVGITGGADSFSILSTSESGNTFTIARDNTGTVTRPCTGDGGCGTDLVW